MKKAKRGLAQRTVKDWCEDTESVIDREIVGQRYFVKKGKRFLTTIEYDVSILKGTRVTMKLAKMIRNGLKDSGLPSYTITKIMKSKEL